MTLDEAIKHCEEVAYQKDLESGFDTDNERYAMTDDERAEGKKSAEEHRQLAEWFRELKRLKEKEESRTVRYESDTAAHCPRCNHTFELLYESWENEFHCPNCGQKLRWEE